MKLIKAISVPISILPYINAGHYDLYNADYDLSNYAAGLYDPNDLASSYQSDSGETCPKCVADKIGANQRQRTANDCDEKCIHKCEALGRLTQEKYFSKLVPDMPSAEQITDACRSKCCTQVSYLFGPPGPRGCCGGVGASGKEGKIGAAGVQGIQGPVGQPGCDGNPGPRGIGLKGDEGPCGPKGQKGVVGDPGIVGIRGIPGLKGPRGAPSVVPGPIGLTGMTGSKGPVGDVGETIPGPRGQRGRPGKTGRQGKTGQTIPGKCGPLGAKGEKGDKGEALFKKIKGSRGPRGKPGLPGDTGSAGKTGLPGLQGYPGRSIPGPRGIAGKKGSQGNEGGRGRTGLRGPAGAAGKPGPQGLQGIPGRNGLPGNTGSACYGDPGAPGNPGDHGKQGTKGRQGEPGDRVRILELIREPACKGPCGIQGPPGKAGIRGSNGKSGPPGEDGPNGRPGIDGADGENATGHQGRQGPKGFTGPAGEPGKSTQRGPPGPPGDASIGDISVILNQLPQEAHINFYAGLSSNIKGVSKPIKFDVILNNDGNGYNAQSGCFIAPTDGVYFFMTNTLKCKNTGDLFVNLMRNKEIISSASNQDDSYQSCSTSAFVHLKKNDMVWIRLRFGHIFGATPSHFTNFMGYRTHNLSPQRRGRDAEENNLEPEQIEISVDELNRQFAEYQASAALEDQNRSLPNLEEAN